MPLLLGKKKWHLEKAYKYFWENMYNAYNRQYSREAFDKVIAVQFNNLLIHFEEAFDINDKDVDEYREELLK